MVAPISKLYIWSIMFEPLMFFVLTSRESFLGVPVSVSRLLQLLVVFFLILSFVYRLLGDKKLTIVNNFFPENKYLVLYFVLLIFAAVVGLFFGGYDLPDQINKVSAFSTGIHPYLSRSLFEYVITGFYIVYFAILPRHLLKTRDEFDYLFSVWKFLLIISLLIGYVDYIFAEFWSIDLVYRHISDGIHVGSRFHGLAGEPRQAAVYIVFSISMYLLYCQYNNINKKIWVVFLLITTFLLTKSMSAFLALIYFIILLSLFRIINVKVVLTLLFLLIFSTMIERVSLYLSYMMDAWQILESGDELPYLLKVQQSSIYPLYDLMNKIRNFDMIPVFFGSGLGSVSAINNIYIGGDISTANPNAQIVRSIFESGIIGTTVFIFAMIWPIKYLAYSIDQKNKNMFIIGMLAVVSVTFSVRSPVVFMYLGILTSFLHVYKQRI
jgi:hypothetical protein